MMWLQFTIPETRMSVTLFDKLIKDFQSIEQDLTIETTKNLNLTSSGKKPLLISIFSKILIIVSNTNWPFQTD